MAVAVACAPSEKQLDNIIAKYRGSPGELLGVLEEIQQHHPHKYLPAGTLEYVSRKTGVPLSKIYSIVTFYAFFNLKPQGEHSIIICRGTACHTRRSKNLLEYLKKLLGLREDEARQGEKVFLTTVDNKFTLKTVACFGQCALAPVVEVDGVIYSHMTENKLKDIVARVARGGKRK
ncbi:MAG TPA: NAD(P)H-dependent oxidoreductase subunit E [Candidatus Omnitrophota bacterium]|nr:NAD(P)H-dependent oxidoreductase subunit E [Candidatus Omnitrophota bacterium]HQJ15676.1 NAD(P)H-dependent oxidoreductase subunit E [Candidatus Omnitrophota bacterium]